MFLKQDFQCALADRGQAHPPFRRNCFGTFKGALKGAMRMLKGAMRTASLVVPLERRVSRISTIVDRFRHRISPCQLS